MLTTPCITAIVGDFGSCKTLLMTALASMYQHEYKIFANYTLIGIKYTKINFEYLAEFPDELRNAIVLIDESSVSMNAYDVFKKDVRKISNFIIQIRKRNIYMFYTIQRWNRSAITLRELTKYFYEMLATEVSGVALIKVYNQFEDETLVSETVFDGRRFFGMYDTEEIIKTKEKNEISQKPLTQ